MKIYATLLVCALVSAVGAQARTVKVTKDSPTAAKLAVVDGGKVGNDQEVPVSTIQRYETLLTRLEAKCIQSRDPRGGQPGLGDMAVTGSRELKKRRPGATALGMLEAMDGGIPGKLKTKMDCTEVAAAIVTLQSR